MRPVLLLALVACGGKKSPEGSGAVTSTVVCPTGTKPQWAEIRHGTNRYCATDDGTPHGPTEEKDGKGNLLTTGMYEHGVLQGKLTRYSPGGDKLAEIEYVDGMARREEVWSADGLSHYICEFADDPADSACTRELTCPEGLVLKRETADAFESLWCETPQGEASGPFRSWDALYGTLREYGQHSEGVRTGTWAFSDRFGRSFGGAYVKGERDGAWTVFQDGLWYEGSYAAGRPVGRWTATHDGIAVAEGDLSGGRLVGAWNLPCKFVQDKHTAAHCAQFSPLTETVALDLGAKGLPIAEVVREGFFPVE